MLCSYNELFVFGEVHNMSSYFADIVEENKHWSEIHSFIDLVWMSDLLQ